MCKKWEEWVWTYIRSLNLSLENRWKCVHSYGSHCYIRLNPPWSSVRNKLLQCLAWGVFIVVGKLLPDWPHSGVIEGFSLYKEEKFVQTSSSEQMVLAVYLVSELSRSMLWTLNMLICESYLPLVLHYGRCLLVSDLLISWVLLPALGKTTSSTIPITLYQ